MLVESLVVSSHGFSFFSLYLEILSKNHKDIFFYVSHFFMFHCTLLFSFFVFFPFHSLNHWRTLHIHVNISCKLLSPPILLDSTLFSLYAITEVSRKPKHALLTIDFKTHFSCTVFFRSVTPIGWVLTR